MVIFTTAYSEHAVTSFELDAVDYLLKPFSLARFIKGCNKAYELFNFQQKSSQKEDLPGYFFVYVEYNLVKINVAEILYIEGMKDYAKIYVSSSSKPIITRMSLKSLEEKLLGYKFVRIHKSYIAAVDKISAIKRDLIVIGDTELPLSETYRPAVQALLSI